MFEQVAIRYGLAFVGGVGLGMFFFVGLWWTIQRGMPSAVPAAWFLTSVIVRTGTVLAMLYLICLSGWVNGVFALAGFVVARFVTTLLVRTSTRMEVEGAN